MQGRCCAWLVEPRIPFAGAEVAHSTDPMGKPACTVFKAYDVGLQAARDMHRIYWQARHPSCESDRRHVREPTRSMLLISTSHRRITKRGTLAWRAKPRAFPDRLQRN